MRRFLLLLSILLAVITAPKPLSAAAPKWIVVRGDYFDLYTDDSENIVLDSAVWLHQFSHVFSGFFGLSSERINRAVVLQFRSQSDFRKYLYSKYGDGYLIALFWLDQFVSYSNDDDSMLSRAIQHEATHWLLRSNLGNMHTWLSGGLAEVYSTFRIKGKTCYLFDPPEENQRWVTTNGFPSPDILIARDRGGLDYNNRSMVSSFYPQAWALTDYLMCSPIDREGVGAAAQLHPTDPERHLDPRDVSPGFRSEPGGVG